jgi:uncharacterized protein
MILDSIIIIFGLALFEVISSIDNAIINAHVLKVLPPKYKKFFLTWGLFIAVFLIRGILPFVVVYMAEDSKDLLLLGGGVYLFMVFLGWLFMEEKRYAFLVEGFIHKQSLWFYAIASLFITLVIYYAVNYHPVLALSATIGATAFFISDGFRKNAEHQEEKLMGSNSSALSKVLFLEVLDASFSIDGVIGAFAFTLSIPLIILGNGLGAIVVREFTIHGSKLLTKYAYLKNGAMYSIGSLGMLMIFEAFGKEPPFWVAPLNTFIFLGIFVWLSVREISDAKTSSKRL